MDTYFLLANNLTLWYSVSVCVSFVQSIVHNLPLSAGLPFARLTHTPREGAFLFGAIL